MSLLIPSGDFRPAVRERCAVIREVTDDDGVARQGLSRRRNQDTDYNWPNVYELEGLPG